MKLTPSQRSLLERRTAAYQASLGLARDYLEGRGFSEGTARSSRLGVVADPLPGDERYLGRLSIPYLTRSGVVSIRFRSLEEGVQAKYLGDPGVESRLYNVEGLFHPEPFVAVAEGELDALTLSQLGIPAVGVPGATNWKPHYSRIFEDYQRVYVFADGDSAGRKFGERVAESVDGVTVIDMPDGMDVGSVYTDMENGAEWLRRKVRR